MYFESEWLYQYANIFLLNIAIDGPLFLQQAIFCDSQMRVGEINNFLTAENSLCKSRLRVCGLSIHVPYAISGGYHLL
jgi:hypothetical protein